VVSDSLKWTSALSVALAVVFVVIIVGVTMWKLFAGEISMPRLTPDVYDQKSFWRLFTVIPVIMTAYICHHNGTVESAFLFHFVSITFL
jgi:sodium-coupled neutral amino acid transporter 2